MHIDFLTFKRIYTWLLGKIENDKDSITQKGDRYFTFHPAKDENSTDLYEGYLDETISFAVGIMLHELLQHFDRWTFERMEIFVSIYGSYKVVWETDSNRYLGLASPTHHIIQCRMEDYEPLVVRNLVKALDDPYLRFNRMMRLQITQLLRQVQRIIINPYDTIMNQTQPQV